MFKEFGKIYYEQEGFNKEVQNILKSYHVKRIQIDDSFLYQYYIVQDGERAETISERLYNNTRFYWIILLINNIINPYTDWPMDQLELEEYTKVKYKNPFAIKHFIDLRNNRIADDIDDRNYRNLGPGSYPAYITPITFYEYERLENVKKKEIVVVNPKYIFEFLDYIEKIIKKGNKE